MPSIAEVTTPFAIVSYTSCVVDLMPNKLSVEIESKRTGTGMSTGMGTNTIRKHRDKHTRAHRLTKVQVDIAIATDGGDVVLLDFPGALSLAGLLARV